MSICLSACAIICLSLLLRVPLLIFLTTYSNATLNNVVDSSSLCRTPLFIWKFSVSPSQVIISTTDLPLSYLSACKIYQICPFMLKPSPVLVSLLSWKPALSLKRVVWILFHIHRATSSFVFCRQNFERCIS